MAPEAPEALEASEKPLVVMVDCMALVYRGHFAMMRNPRVTSAGLNTSALFVVANTLLDLRDKHGATHLVMVSDARGPIFRHDRYPEYKANREAMPEEIEAALPYVDQLCAGLNIPVVRLAGYEADDIIGTLAGRAVAAGMAAAMVTPDKDYGQLVTDGVAWWKPGRRGEQMEKWDSAAVCERWGGIASPERVIDILALMGDASDNIPGVKGIGEKTAITWLVEFGSLENIYENLDKIKGKRREYLERDREMAFLSKELVTIEKAVPIEAAWDDFLIQGPDQIAMAELCDTLEFRTLRKRLLAEPSGGTSVGDPASDVTSAESATPAEAVALRRYQAETVTYQGYQDESAWHPLLQEALRQDRVCLDLETDSLDARQAIPIGVALSWQTGTGHYIAVTDENRQAVLAGVGELVSDPRRVIIGHNLHYDLTVLAWHGVRCAATVWDTLVAATLINPDRKLTMDALAGELLSYEPISIQTLLRPADGAERTMAEVPFAEQVPYACEDADITWQLAEKLAPQLEDNGVRALFEQVEAPLVNVLVTMEHHGVALDEQRLAELRDEFIQRQAQLSASIFSTAGEEFNLNSPKQLGEVLFEKLKLDPYAKRTGKSKQYKTGEEVLTKLARKHAIAGDVLAYRGLGKLLGTYVDALPAAVDDRTQRVHTHYEQLVAATGRLASHNPNLQNIPVRTADGREIRKAFVPRDENYLILSADYSQIELRVLAHLSGDPGLQAAFASGEDIHQATAAQIFQIAPEEVDAEQRRRAKTVNFGIIYGLSPFGLASRLSIPLPVAKEMIEGYFARFNRVRDFIDETVAFATENGYVTTMMGRRRYLPDIRSRNATQRSGAERVAVNTPIQGSAADMIKAAMVRVDQLLREGAYASQLVLQVHDELVFDLHREEAATLQPLIEQAMREALPLSVPIEVTAGIGEDWLQAH